jgi:hypothetical protein
MEPTREDGRECLSVCKVHYGTAPRNLCRASSVEAQAAFDHRGTRKADGVKSGMGETYAVRGRGKGESLMTDFEKSIFFAKCKVNNRIENNIGFTYARLKKGGFSLDESINIIMALLDPWEKEELEDCAKEIECKNGNNQLKYLFMLMLGILPNPIEKNTPTIEDNLD